MSPSNLSVTLCGRPYDATTQLREILACKSPFSKCIWRGGRVTTWVPTHVPQLLVTHTGVFLPSYVPCMHITPWDVALSWVVSVLVVF